MPMTRTAAAAVVLVALTGSLGACGNGDDDKASKAISDSIIKQQGSGGAGSILSMDRKDADCIGDGFVDKIGTDQLKKYGLLTKDMKTKQSVSNIKMSAGDAKSASTVLFGCTDVEKMMGKAIGGSAQTKSLPASVKACISKALTEAQLRPMFTKVFQGQQTEAQRELTEPLMKCAQG